MVGKIISLADVTFNEDELIQWIEESEWCDFKIEQQYISDVMSMLVGSRIVHCEVCDLEEDKHCSAILMCVKKEGITQDNYFLILIEAWDCDDSIIGVGSSLAY